MGPNQYYGAYEAITLGLELERDGYNFYSHVAKATIFPPVRDLFLSLAEAETRHMKVIKEEIEPAFTPEWYREEDQQLLREYLRDVERQPIFPSPEKAEAYARDAKEVGKALDIGIVAEQRSMDYYVHLRDTTRNEKGREAFARLYLEEEKHLAQLRSLKKSL